MMRAKTIGPYIWGARSGGDGTTFNGRDRQAHDRTVQAARCQLFKRHQRTLCDPVASSERGHVRAPPRLPPLHEPANAIAEGRRRWQRSFASIFLLGRLLGFGNIGTSGMTTTITGEDFSSMGPRRQTIRSDANLFFYRRH